MVGRAWDFNHRNKARTFPFFRCAHNTSARAVRDTTTAGTQTHCSFHNATALCDMQTGIQSNDQEPRVCYWKHILRCNNIKIWVRPYKERLWSSCWTLTSIIDLGNSNSRSTFSLFPGLSSHDLHQQIARCGWNQQSWVNDNCWFNSIHCEILKKKILNVYWSFVIVLFQNVPYRDAHVETGRIHSCSRDVREKHARLARKTGPTWTTTGILLPLTVTVYVRDRVCECVCVCVRAKEGR